MLGTIKRSDGTTQVTSAGWPVYTFVEDKKPGADNGTDSKAFGASWPSSVIACATSSWSPVDTESSESPGAR